MRNSWIGAHQMRNSWFGVSSAYKGFPPPALSTDRAGWSATGGYDDVDGDGESDGDGDGDWDAGGDGDDFKTWGSVLVPSTPSRGGRILARGEPTPHLKPSSYNYLFIINDKFAEPVGHGFLHNETMKRLWDLLHYVLAGLQTEAVKSSNKQAGCIHICRRCYCTHISS